MFGDSIPIPAGRVVPVATEAASNAKTVAAVLFFFVAVFAFAVVGMAVDGVGDKSDTPGTIGGVAFWLLIIASVAMRFVKTARRANASAQRAKADPNSQWFLSGKMIVGADVTGVPSPELTFKISGKLRTMLLAVPSATVVEHGKLAP